MELYKINNKEIKLFFNENAKNYIGNKYFTNKRGIFVKRFINKEDSILEVGIGSGDLAAIYSDGIITGCDISKNMIDRAQKKLPKSKLSVCDAEYLNYDSFSFDVIVASEMIYYLKNPIKFFIESERVLKPKGRLILIFGNENYNFLYKILSYIKLRSHDPYSLKTPSVNELMDLLISSVSESNYYHYGIGMPGFLNGSDNKIITFISPVNGILMKKIN